VALTVLVDNKADLIVKSTENVKYFTDKPLLAEHGFSVLIQLDGLEEKILWDAGVSKEALMENMRRMELDPKSIAKIALSHGHLDHYAAMTDLLNAMELQPEGKEWKEGVTEGDLEAWVEGFKIEIVAHPAAFRERWWVKDDGTYVGPYSKPPVLEWKAAGAEITLSEGPYELAPGCWTTGYVPRASFEESGRPAKLRYRQGPEFLADDLEEDQAVVFNLEGKGLVVLSGCAHSGIVNTVEHARAMTGIDQVYAVLGGFHMARSEDEEIDRTIEFMKELNPVFLIPSHCTGFRAISRFANEMPEAFVEGVVGTTYLF
jgi:7,8-dihydropterin-6-yl-methyl-4-(beta-D-ribofuranosyl)aminobenzene 5'-phosphate synthase